VQALVNVPALLPHLSASIDACVTSAHVNLWQFAAEGAVAGGCRALSRGLTFPFDTIKTLEQVDRPKIDKALTNANMSGGAKQEVDVEPIAYFRGVTLTVTSAVPANALFFLIYNTLEVILPCALSGPVTGPGAAGPMPLSLTSRILITILATLPQNVFKIPAEVIKQRAQSQPRRKIMDIAREAVEGVDGWRGLYAGGDAQLLREIPYNIIQMVSYAYMKDFFLTNYVVGGSSAVLSSNAAAVIGLLAAANAALWTTPVDVLKTRLMTSPDPSKTSIISEARKILATEGIAGLFIGYRPRLALVSIGGSVYFYTSALAEEWFKLHT